MKHYFSEDADDVISNPKDIEVNIFDSKFIFTTDNGVFSKDYLDYASGLLLKNLEIGDNVQSILDVGCGYGPIGIILNKIYNKKITMIDVNPRALALAQLNVSKNKAEAEIYKSDCLTNVSGKFDMIITNPPIRAGKEVIYKIFEQSVERLSSNGELWLIIQYNHGAPSAIKKLKSLYTVVETVYKKKGFYIIKCYNGIDN